MEMRNLKWSVANKIIQIINAKKFFNVNNMKYFDRATSFTKFDIYCIIPEPSRVDFPCILQLTTFICQLMVFMEHALQYEELTRKLWHKIFRFIWRFLWLTSTFCLSFLHLNFTMTSSFFNFFIIKLCIALEQEEYKAYPQQKPFPNTIYLQSVNMV